MTDTQRYGGEVAKVIAEREVKFTPGPWAIDRDDRPDMEWNNHIVRADDPNIAICYMTHSGSDDNSECEANAHLIASAPDLLAALQRYVAAYPAFRMKPIGAPNSEKRIEQENLMSLEDSARAAIAKATGEKS